MKSIVNLALVALLLVPTLGFAQQTEKVPGGAHGYTPDSAFEPNSNIGLIIRSNDLHNRIVWEQSQLVEAYGKVEAARGTNESLKADARAEVQLRRSNLRSLRQQLQQVERLDRQN